ncbi:MAG TPA: Type 1 glutamine amidotransferase-like domain-containing protein [Solirubrobacterales bacterium]|nr:Type 1 glutamine amidotransferase-like domain-containing protein [Solirubrobacterales bacterium]
MREDRRLILALGGHEFSRRRGDEALRDYMLALAPATRPKICLLPTASGDPAEQIAAFRRSLGGFECELSHVSLFRLEHERVRVAEHLLTRDLIYVGGGSLVNLLAIWRAHRLDRVLRRAWESGVVLCGQSAGAMCWFEAGVSRSAGSASDVAGLGLVPGVLSVHYHRDDDRQRALHAAVANGAATGYGVDDGAGLLIRGRTPAVAVSGRDGAGVWRVEPDGNGSVVETRLAEAPVPDPRPAIDEVPAAVRELRRVRRTRERHRGRR